jgi:hypothetical protein
MPSRNRKGPAGSGPITSKDAVNRSGKVQPDYINPVDNRYAPWFGRAAIYWRAMHTHFQSAGYYNRYPLFPYYRTTSKQAIRILKNEEKRLKDELKTIHARIDKLEKEKAKGKNNSQKTAG